MLKLKSKSRRKPRILGVIPARGGSKGIKNKNLAFLRGRPLIGWAIKVCRASKMVNRVIVSTDDDETMKIARSYDAEVVFRSKEISGDQSRDIEYLKHALHWATVGHYKPDIIAWFPPDCPLRVPADIDQILEYMVRENLDSIRTAVAPEAHPLKMCVMYKGKMTPVISLTPFSELGAGVPRQLLPDALLPFGMVNATKVEFIKNGKLWGKRTECYPVARNKYLDIDTPEQLEEAQKRVRKFIIK